MTARHGDERAADGPERRAAARATAHPGRYPFERRRASATATLLAYVGGGGLGRFIIDGSRISYDDPRVFVGALFVALLSVAVELVLGLIERITVPRALRTRDAFVSDDATRVAA